MVEWGSELLATLVIAVNYLYIAWTNISFRIFPHLLTSMKSFFVYFYAAYPPWSGPFCDIEPNHEYFMQLPTFNSPWNWERAFFYHHLTPQLVSLGPDINWKIYVDSFQHVYPEPHREHDIMLGNHVCHRTKSAWKLISPHWATFSE